MAKVNFVEEFKQMMRIAKDDDMPLRERMLWIALFYLANDRARSQDGQTYEWPEDFIPIANAELGLYTTLDKRGIEYARNGLKQRGLIDFIPGYKNKTPAKYMIHYQTVFRYKNVPKTDPKVCPKCVQSASNDVPKVTPFDINKRINESVVIYQSIQEQENTEDDGLTDGQMDSTWQNHEDFLQQYGLSLEWKDDVIMKSFDNRWGTEWITEERPEDDDIIRDMERCALSLILESKDYVQIGGNQWPWETAVSRIMVLEQDQIRYVLDGLSKTSKPIRNMRAYLLTCMLNSPCTMGSYYAAERG